MATSQQSTSARRKAASLSSIYKSAAFSFDDNKQLKTLTLILNFAARRRIRPPLFSTRRNPNPATDDDYDDDGSYGKRKENKLKLVDRIPYLGPDSDSSCQDEVLDL